MPGTAAPTEKCTVTAIDAPHDASTEAPPVAERRCGNFIKGTGGEPSVIREFLTSSTRSEGGGTLDLVDENVAKSYARE
jgi:hypothetical protein